MEKMAEKIDSMVNERRLLRLGYVTRLALNSIDRSFLFRTKQNRSKLDKNAKRCAQRCKYLRDERHERRKEDIRIFSSLTRYIIIFYPK